MIPGTPRSGRSEARRKPKENTMSERKVIDARGSFCPGPLMELIGWIKLAQVGDELEVLSTDKGSANEIPEWVKKVGHDFLGAREEDGVWHVTVRKAK
jgi:tRNA 2-thiouridine synthesizing protein A